MSKVNPFQPASKSVALDGKTSTFTHRGLPDHLARRVEDIALNSLVPFPNHPFKVLDDDAMASLMDSIARDGIHTPLIIRPNKNDDNHFEIISGHRRAHAAQKLGLNSVPAIVVHVDDDRATVMMVDANLNRPKLLLSERAKSMRQRYEALRHQGVNRGSTTDITAQFLGKHYQKSEKTIRRMVALGRLPDSVLDLVDARRISETFARGLLRLSHSQAEHVATYIRQNPDIKIDKKSLPALNELAIASPAFSSAQLDHIFRATPSNETITVRIPVSWLPKDIVTRSQITDFLGQAIQAYQSNQ